VATFQLILQSHPRHLQTTLKQVANLLCVLGSTQPSYPQWDVI